MSPQPGGPPPDPAAVLERRLSDGYQRIEDAMGQGQNVEAWVDFWIDLLRQYETAMDAKGEDDAT